MISSSKILLLILSILFLICSCDTPAPKEKAAPTPTPQSETDEHHGRTSNWTEKQMEFQMTYCHQIMSKIEDTDIEGYCNCFLNKVKYYYPANDILHAYRQEAEFSQQCMEQFYHGEKEE